jgi:hypothetical protein
MATFRSRPIDTDWTPIPGHAARVVVLALLSLACAPRESGDGPSPEVAAITTQHIQHVTPRPDFVGPAPTRLEWTRADGVDTYNVTVITEIDSVVFQMVGTRNASIDWPPAITLEPGTYFWRVVGFKGEQTVADSGRSAFVVRQ